MVEWNCLLPEFIIIPLGVVEQQVRFILSSFGD
jgi:hypothetical protein